MQAMIVREQSKFMKSTFSFLTNEPNTKHVKKKVFQPIQPHKLFVTSLKYDPEVFTILEPLQQNMPQKPLY